MNPSLSSIRYQNTNCWYPILIQISQCISTGANFKTDQTVCEMQSGVWKWCWRGTWGKMLQRILGHNNEHWSICTVMFVLFTDSASNKIVFILNKLHEWRTVHSATFFGFCFFSIVESVIRIFGLIQDIHFLECQCNIYRLVQNILPADMNLQMRRYQEYSKK
jgi:hypothetical protein